MVDASVVVAALLRRDDDGVWAESLLMSDQLAAPHFMPAEAANILRRAVLAGGISADAASLAHGELLQMPAEMYAYGPLAERAWELRGTVTVYDAWYVALAEALGAELATLDLRLTRAPGPRCPFITPPS